MKEERQRTIGGRKISEVFRLLTEEIPGIVQYMDGTKYPYLDVDEVTVRFESIVPKENYTFEVSDLSFFEVSKKENPSDKKSKALLQTYHGYAFSCIGKLTIYDDDGQFVTLRAMTGSSNCEWSRNNVMDLSTDIKCAHVDARKNCMVALGVGERQLNEEKKRRKNGYGNPQGDKRNTGGGVSSPQNSSPTGDKGQPQGDMPQTGRGRFRVYLDRSAGGGSFEGKMYLMPVVMMDYNNYKTKILVWKNNKQAEQVINTLESSNVLVCDGKFEQYGGNYRIVFEGVALDR